MATPKRWSRTVGTRRGNRIRVYERDPGGKLYAAFWDPERHKYTQTGLGHRDHERALREVGELVATTGVGRRSVWTPQAGHHGRAFPRGKHFTRATAL